MLHSRSLFRRAAAELQGRWGRYISSVRKSSLPQRGFCPRCTKSVHSSRKYPPKSNRRCSHLVWERALWLNLIMIGYYPENYPENGPYRKFTEKFPQMQVFQGYVCLKGYPDTILRVCRKNGGNEGREDYLSVIQTFCDIKKLKDRFIMDCV